MTEGKQIVIRDNDYYGGSLYVENMPKGEYDDGYVTLVWVAYQGGGSHIVFQSATELETVGKLLLHAAELTDPDRIERGGPVA